LQLDVADDFLCHEWLLVSSSSALQGEPARLLVHRPDQQQRETPGGARLPPINQTLAFTEAR